MSYSSTMPPSGANPPPPLLSFNTAPPPKKKNTLGIVAFIMAIVGFVFACIPGALIVGWILLPISFILAIVSLFLKGGKGFGVAALVTSVVGTVVGVMVFVSTVTTAFDKSFSADEVATAQPGVNATQPESTDEAQNVQGTRETPYPIGTAITQGDWTVTVNSTTLDATQEILAENMFNEPPAEGSQYLIANITATYNGNSPQGATPVVDLEYVTAGGNTLNSYDHSAVTPDQFDSGSALYTGASTTGNISFEVPSDSASEGVYALRPAMFGDKVFVEVQ